MNKRGFVRQSMVIGAVQLDSITYNELGDPHALATVEGRPDLKGLQSWQDQAQLGEKHSLTCRQKV